MAARTPLCATNARERARATLRRLAARGRRRAGDGVMNLLSSLPDARTAEQTETLLTRPGMRVERIVSLGQTSPPGFWYDQPQANGCWCLPAPPSCGLPTSPRRACCGPAIGSHRRHRIDWT